MKYSLNTHQLIITPDSSRHPLEFYQNQSTCLTYRMKFHIVTVLLLCLVITSCPFKISRRNVKQLEDPKKESSLVVKHRPSMEYKEHEEIDPANSSLNGSEDGGNGKKNASAIYLFPTQTFLNQGDRLTQEEWGGNCTLADWDRCKVVKTWFGWYLDRVESEMKWKHMELDCVLEPVLCMKNGWTVNRCHILCMGRCNKELLYKYDKYISHEEECKAHAHGRRRRKNADE